MTKWEASDSDVTFGFGRDDAAWAAQSSPKSARKAPFQEDVSH